MPDRSSHAVSKPAAWQWRKINMYENYINTKKPTALLIYTSRKTNTWTSSVFKDVH